MSPVISLVDVRYRHGTTTVLELERLVIPPGTTAVLGPNGAGKSTLLRMLATVSPPSAGTILIDGSDVSDPAARVAIRRRLGYAAQLDNLPARMRVGEYCDYVAALKEIGPRRRRCRWIDHVLDEVGLSERAEERISALSGGMRRRLVLAQSLLGRPDLLVLDEPLVSLDAEHRSAMVRLIAASADHRTTVVATHHSDEMAAVCRNVVVLVAGRLVFAGTPADLAAQATGLVWESAEPGNDPSARALAPDRFRIVGTRPPGGHEVEPTVHDGYLAVLARSSSPAGC